MFTRPARSAEEDLHRLRAKYLVRLHPLNSIAFSIMFGGMYLAFLPLALRVTPLLERWGYSIPPLSAWTLGISVGYPGRAFALGLVWGCLLQWFTSRWFAADGEAIETLAAKALGQKRRLPRRHRKFLVVSTALMLLPLVYAATVPMSVLMTQWSVLSVSFLGYRFLRVRYEGVLEALSGGSEAERAALDTAARERLWRVFTLAFATPLFFGALYLWLFRPPWPFL